MQHTVNVDSGTSEMGSLFFFPSFCEKQYCKKKMDSICSNKILPFQTLNQPRIENQHKILNSKKKKAFKYWLGLQYVWKQYVPWLEFKCCSCTLVFFFTFWVNENWCLINTAGGAEVWNCYQVEWMDISWVAVGDLCLDLDLVTKGRLCLSENTCSVVQLLGPQQTRL